MVKNIFFLFLVSCFFSACCNSVNNFDENGKIAQDFLDRRNLVPEKYFSVFDGDLDGEKLQAMQFLYAYMPLPDIADYPSSFYLQNVDYALKARKEMPWGEDVPVREFMHFVLPVRVNNEDMDTSRAVFYNELKERVCNLSMRDAVLEVNHWCHEKVTYTPSDSRTSSPLASVRTAYGRCGEESTFTVAALRAVGIPARQVYTPRWAHTDDNHAWVEAWVDGEWHFLGACEPEPVLDLAWFNAPASRGMLMHTKAFGHYNGPEEVVSSTPCYTETIPASIVVTVQLIASFAILFTMSPTLAISVIVALPVAMLASRFYIKRMRKLNREVRDSDSRIQSVLQESLQHKALIKALEQNNSTEQQLTTLQEKLQGQVRNRTKFSLGAYSLTQLGFATGYLIAFMWGVYGLANGTVTFGTLSAYLQLVGLIQRPTVDLSRFIPSIVSSLTAAERLYELEDIPQEQQGDAKMLKGAVGVQFKDVCFRYDGEERDVFDNFNYTFAPGSRTAIIGKTGAGKTTLIRLLVALITPDKGSIKLYNENENCTSSPLTRCNFVYIPQGNSLISGTIRDNLLMGNPNATEEEMKNALHIACAEYVNELPQGIDTKLSEQGGGLSEGQAQRIAVARSILRPGSILILDEVTSALDEATEQEMLRRLTSSQTGKTLIFVTHRPAIIEYCDQILKIEKTEN